jgi:hypothetical protein
MSECHPTWKAQKNNEWCAQMIDHRRRST